MHAEDAEAIDRAPAAGGYRYADFLASRPRGAENVAIAGWSERARWTGARVHVLHLSSSDALPMIASARRDGVRITVETCPHYLTFTAEAVPDGATQFKCCPPIREAANRELLWGGLADGLIDCVVSRPLAVAPRSSSGSTPATSARPGAGSRRCSWGSRRSGRRPGRAGIALDDVVRWMASGPAALAGLPGRAGSRVGADADFASSRRTRRAWSTRCGCTTATR